MRPILKDRSKRLDMEGPYPPSSFSQTGKLSLVQKKNILPQRTVLRNLRHCDKIRKENNKKKGLFRDVDEWENRYTQEFSIQSNATRTVRVSRIDQ